MTLPIPTEDREQQTVVEYFRLKNILHFHVPNSTYTTSIKQKAKNKRLGVVPGVPDLFFFVNGNPYAIEMKRRKGGSVSEFQIKWIDALNSNGVETVVARGSVEAIEFIKSKEGK